MKKKSYIKPTADILFLGSGDLLDNAGGTTSIQNSESDVQSPVGQYDDDDMDIGAKDNKNQSVWDAWE